MLEFVSRDAVAIPLALVALIPIVYFAKMATGPLAWALWAVAIFISLNVAIFVWINLVWRLVLRLFGDVF